MGEKSPILRYFEFEHLPEGPLRDTSRNFHALAHVMEDFLPRGLEKSIVLRKLLEARGAAVVLSALDLATPESAGEGGE